MSIKEKFEGVGDKMRAATRGGMVFLGIALFAAIAATQLLLSTTNGFASVWVFIGLVLMINWASARAKRSYDSAMEGDEE